MNRMLLNAIVAALCAGVASAGATFTTIEFLPGGGYISASAISDDGRVVVGTGSTSEGSRAFRWTHDAGTVAIDVLPGTATARAYGVSGDGGVIVGDSLNTSPLGYRPFIWTETGGIAEMSYPSGAFYVSPYGANGDGSVIVGASEFDPSFSPSHAILWSSGKGYERLDELPGMSSSAAFDSSEDGSVVVGTGRMFGGAERAFRWTREHGMQGLSGLRGEDIETFAGSVSNDGSVIGGYVRDQEGTVTAVRWSDDGATVTDLGTLFGFDSSRVSGVSGDGSVIVGQATSGELLRAVLWNESLEIVDLNEFLPSLGLDLTGWVLTAALDVSADGMTLIGEGIFDGARRAWVATIPAPGAAGLMAVAGIVCARRRR